MFAFTRRCSSLSLGLFAILVLIAMLSVTAVAQSVTGSISGSVTDLTGGILVGATVTLHSDKTGSVRNATTNRKADSLLPLSIPGCIRSP